MTPAVASWPTWNLEPDMPEEASNEVEWVSVAELLLDSRNPRLTDDEELSQDQLTEKLWREYAVDEIAMSIAANGYFRHEPLFVDDDNNQLTVIEGNRRLAAVKILIDSQLRAQLKAPEFVDLTSELVEELSELPIIRRSRTDVWQYVGFKHVNGPQPWQSSAKAQYIAWVHNELEIPLAQIARQIGDRHATVRRLYRGQMAIEQAAATQVFLVDDRYNRRFAFSHLYTGLDYPNIQTYLGIEPEESYKPNPVPEDHIEHLGHLCIWLYGSTSRDTKPLIRSQNPDLRTLEETLAKPEGIEALRHGRDLDVAREIAIGDPALFRRDLVDAKLKLQSAQGRQTGGDTGDQDSLELVIQILDIADSLRLTMQAVRRGERPRRSERHGTTL